MRRSIMWVAAAALFASVLSGQGEAADMTAQHGAGGPAGNGTDSASHGDTPRHDGVDAIRRAPSEPNCQDDRDRSDVFELQCESNTSND